MRTAVVYVRLLCGQITVLGFTSVAAAEAFDVEAVDHEGPSLRYPARMPSHQRRQQSRQDVNRKAPGMSAGEDEFAISDFETITCEAESCG